MVNTEITLKETVVLALGWGGWLLAALALASDNPPGKPRATGQTRGPALLPHSLCLLGPIPGDQELAVWTLGWGSCNGARVWWGGEAGRPNTG